MPIQETSKHTLPSMGGPAADQAPASASIDLKREFPMSFRRSLKKSFWLFVLFLVMARVALFLHHQWVPTLAGERNIALANLSLISATLLCFFAWLGRLAYYEVERASYEYKLTAGNIYLKRGLLVKYTGSFPLSRITDIYLHRGMGDWFWGLSSLHISTPTTASGEFAYIHGLLTKDAEALQGRLELLVKEHDRRMEGRIIQSAGDAGDNAASPSGEQTEVLEPAAQAGNQ